MSEIDQDTASQAGVPRRTVLIGGAAGLAVVLGGLVEEAVAAGADPALLQYLVDVALTINGQAHALSLDPRVTLLDLLREGLHLTGSKKSCDHGQCGACTVLVNGRRINSCLTLAVLHDGDSITTIEGLGTPDALHPMQAAFIRHDGFQCGYCTPGQICSAVAMLQEIGHGLPSHVTEVVAEPVAALASLGDDELRERMSGNICRCAGYPNIIAAIREAAAELAPTVRRAT